MFYKYCRKEHNIKEGCQKIHIGTLEYYKELDPDFSIADKNEGSYEYDIDNYDPKKVPQEDRLLGGIHLIDINLIHNFPNCYIFSLSQRPPNKDGDDERLFAEDYDSYYQIKNVNRFGEKIVQLLYQHIGLNNFKKEVLINKFTLKEFKEILIYMQHYPVEYVEKKIKVNEQNNASVPGPTINNLVFKKDKKYSHEKEYRIVFVLYHPTKGVLQVKKGPLLLPINIFYEELL